MFLFKREVIPSGFNHKRLVELLRVYEKNDPKGFVKTAMNLGDPDPEFRVHWVSKDEFDFKYFPYFTGRGGKGYQLAQSVRVKISGASESPVLTARVLFRIRLLDLWNLVLLGLLWSLIVYIGFNFSTPSRDPTTLKALLWGYVMIPFSAFYVFFKYPNDCVMRLRHMTASDDWGPEALKTSRHRSKT